jgi:hypothetical protein
MSLPVHWKENLIARPVIRLCRCGNINILVFARNRIARK